MTYYVNPSKDKHDILQVSHNLLALCDLNMRVPVSYELDEGEEIQLRGSAFCRFYYPEVLQLDSWCSDSSE